MQRAYLFFLAASLFLASCRPDPVEPYSPAPVIAGVVGDSMVLHVNLNPQPPVLVWDSLNQFAEGHDSLDLDLDGSVDLDIDMRIVNPDSQHLISLGYQVPYFKFSGRNNWFIGYYEEMIPMGMGAFMELDWVSKLSLGDTVDTQVTKFLSSVNLWMTPPINASYGPWYLETQTKYAAMVRIQATSHQMGWMEIDCPNREQISIARWAYHL